MAERGRAALPEDAGKRFLQRRPRQGAAQFLGPDHPHALPPCRAGGVSRIPGAVP